LILSYHITGGASVCWKSSEGGQANIVMDGPIVKGKCMKNMEDGISLFKQLALGI
jgi:hypothetical protein